MSIEPQEVMKGVLDAHWVVAASDGRVRCHCSRRFDSYSGPNQFHAHVVEEQLAALTAEGLRIENVGGPFPLRADWTPDYYALLADQMPELHVDDSVPYVVNECMKAARRAFMQWERAMKSGQFVPVAEHSPEEPTDG